MTKKSLTATLRVVDHDVAESPRPDDLAKLSVPLSPMLTAELDGAQLYLRVSVDDLLLAALGRAIARTIGSGHVSVDVGRGSFAVPLACTTVKQVSATKALSRVHRSLHAGPHQEEAARSDILFLSMPPDPDPAFRNLLPCRGHALELRVYRSDGQLQMDWWYDTRKFDRYTVEELTEQFPLALIDLTSEAAPVVHDASAIAAATSTFAMADS
jgi:hypothetical protein